MKFHVSCAAAMLLTTAACSDMGGMGGASTASSDAPMGAAMPGDMTPTAAMPFVAMAGASDLYEIQSSQIALQKSQNPQVREFAQMMIAHHTQTTQQVTAAARAAGMNPPPPQLMPMQANMIARLQPLSGAAFDRMYIMQQRRAHEMALALHTNYARNGDTAQLRTAASTAAPIVQQHLDRVRTLNAG